MAARIHFGCFEADIASGQLFKRGMKVALREKSFQVLASLLERPGETISREELHRRLWPECVFVDFENNLNVAVARLREALGDSPQRPHFIETLPRRGYRFIQSISEPRQSEHAVHRGITKLVVLPFVNLTGDDSKEYLSDGITDEIITHLAASSPDQLAVIARTTAMHFKGSHKDVGQIGRMLHVEYAVEGSVTKIDESVGLSVQLIRVSDQVHVFARKYEGDMREILGMQSVVANAIAAHLPGAAQRLRDRAVTVGTSAMTKAEVGAYNSYLKARYLFERGTPDAASAAMSYYQEAIKRDPEFAPAQMALASLYSLVGYLGYMRPKDSYGMGLKYALRAVELADGLSEAHAVLAEYKKQIDYDWLGAEREMARALALDRTSPFVRFRNAIVILMPQNRLDEALSEIEAALELDPLAVLTRAWLGIMLLLARDYERAISAARDLLQLEPASSWPHFIIGIAYRQKYVDNQSQGLQRPEFAEIALTEHRKAVEMSPGSDFFLGWLGLALGICGERAQAQAVLDQLQRTDRYVLPSNFAHVLLGLGEIDAAFKYFNLAVEECDQMMMPILSYAHYDPIRKDPRFASLLRKMKLAERASP